MAVELKNAADRCKLLEKEARAAEKDLEKATTEAKDPRSAMRAMKEELPQAGDIAAGKPFLLRRKFMDPKYAQLDRLWSAEDAYLLGGQCGGRGRTLPRSRGSRNGKGFLVAVP